MGSVAGGHDLVVPDGDELTVRVGDAGQRSVEVARHVFHGPGDAIGAAGEDHAGRGDVVAPHAMNWPSP